MQSTAYAHFDRECSNASWEEIFTGSRKGVELKGASLSRGDWRASGAFSVSWRCFFVCKEYHTQTCLLFFALIVHATSFRRSPTRAVISCQAFFLFVFIRPTPSKPRVGRHSTQNVAAKMFCSTPPSERCTVRSETDFILLFFCTLLR
jgi:hypothetical protein